MTDALRLLVAVVALAAAVWAAGAVRLPDLSGAPALFGLDRAAPPPPGFAAFHARPLDGRPLLVYRADEAPLLP